MLNDVIPLSLTRTYRQLDPTVRAFGVGMSMDYEMFISGDNNFTTGGFSSEDLILADGGQIHFTNTSTSVVCNNGICGEGSGSPGAGSLTFAATSTPTDFYGATLTLLHGYGQGGTACPGFSNLSNCWVLTKKDGTVYQFPATDNDNNNPRQYALTSISDRYGNTVNLTRDASTGNLLKVTSPNGRWIQFTYDTSNRVTQAQDNMGRITSYTYDPISGGLATATDANGKVTSYTYDPDGDMLTITDPRNIQYLQNVYDANGFVSQQILANTGTYNFAYTLTMQIVAFPQSVLPHPQSAPSRLWARSQLGQLPPPFALAISPRQP